jgi:uncharacterized protein (TIGR02271 family)
MLSFTIWEDNRMNEDQRVSRDVVEQKLSEGAAIMDASGETIGTVANYDMQGGSMIVSGGMLFPEDTRIPLDAIGDTGASGIYLKGDKDELLQRFAGGGVGSSQTAATAMASAQATSPIGEVDEGVSPAQEVDQVVAADTATTEATEADVTTSPSVERGEEDIRVPVMEEELVVGKRAEEVGRVNLRKDVVEEQQTVDVPLRREQVTVERVPVDGTTDTTVAQDAFTERDIDVPVMGEEAVVGKEVREVEEVRLHKDTVSQEEQVSDTVRKERVTIDGADEGMGATSTAGVMDRTMSGSTAMDVNATKGDAKTTMS